MATTPPPLHAASKAFVAPTTWSQPR